MLLLAAFLLVVVLSITLIFLVIKFKVFIRFNFLAIVINVFLFSSALFMIYNSTEDFSRYQEMKKWTEVSGIVVDGNVVGERAKRPELTYNYQIGEVVYTGLSDLATPSFGGKNYRDQSSRAVVSKFEKGDSILVYYNPADYKQSVLKILPKWSSYLQYGLGVIFLSLAFGFLFSGLLERK